MSTLATKSTSPTTTDPSPSASHPPKRASLFHTLWPEPDPLGLRREWAALHAQYRADRAAVDRAYKAERAGLDAALRQVSERHRRRAQADARREGPGRLWRALFSYARARWRFRRSREYGEAVAAHAARRAELERWREARLARALDECLEGKEGLLRRMPRGLETFRGVPK